MEKRLIAINIRVLVAASVLGASIFIAPTASANTITYSQDQCEAEVNSTTTISSNSVQISLISDLSKKYCVIIFKDTKTYQLTILRDSPKTADYLVVAGGGGGNSGGGGAGGFLEGILDVENKTIAVTVGTGGSGGSGGNYTGAPVGTSGGFSQLGNGVITIKANGGGFGGYKKSSITNGANGGSGGGGAWDAGTGTAGNGTTNQGFAGGTSSLTNYKGGGGGGGAGAIGSAGGSRVDGCGGPGGAGGIGKQSSITGIASYYAGGGGGGVNSNCGNSTSHSGGAGGNGGGGKGSSYGLNDSTKRGAKADAAAGTANTGGGGGGTDPEDSGAGAGGSGVVIVRYEIDLTAPTLSATSFTISENLSTPYTAATITLSESSTISSVAGADLNLFSLLSLDSNTVVINFNAPPDFESPTDTGGDNVYEVSFVATDLVGNATITQLITITVSDVLDTSSFNSLSLAGAVLTATYRSAITITADVSVISKITIRQNGKVLPGCKNQLASGSGSNFIFICSWKPSMRGYVTLTAVAKPSNALIPTAIATPVKVFVTNRSGRR